MSIYMPLMPSVRCPCSIWGIGLSPEEAQQAPESAWRGLNLLGQALTQVREEIRAAQRLGQRRRWSGWVLGWAASGASIHARSA
jgi:hypothetical protein